MKKFLLTTIVALSAATAGASDYIEHKIYSDKNFEQNRAKAVKNVGTTRLSSSRC